MNLWSRDQAGHSRAPRRSIQGPTRNLQQKQKLAHKLQL